MKSVLTNPLFLFMTGIVTVIMCGAIFSMNADPRAAAMSDCVRFAQEDSTRIECAKAIFGEAK